MSTPQTPHKLFIQMSGAPGSGKSTLARLLGRSIGGVVIDHDVFRSTLLEFNTPFDQAAKQAYKIQWKLAQDIVKQGINIIIDSPCNFQEVLDQGSALSKDHGYVYWYVECKVESIDLLDQRLRTREPMASQRTGIDRHPTDANGAHAGGQESRALFEKWMKTPCRPEDNIVIVDSTDDPVVLRDRILKQIVG
ncbi:hypothetical protein M434DRAFT_151621 [Hypoxylon sp. CO27-5]|nr:hypothetical protein M434DRAFT_151621 [Hypoxylon sp. CO27-5]